MDEVVSVTAAAVRLASPLTLFDALSYVHARRVLHPTPHPVLSSSPRGTFNMLSLGTAHTEGRFQSLPPLHLPPMVPPKCISVRSLAPYTTHHTSSVVHSTNAARGRVRPRPQLHLRPDHQR